MHHKIKLSIILSCALAVVGCAPTPLIPGAERVLVTPNQPDRSCKYLGQVVGSQGGAFTGAYTSNRNLEEGSFNDMRNQAERMGANYVQLVTSRAADTGSFSSYNWGGVGRGIGGSSGQTSVTGMGNAYYCKHLN